MADPNINLYGIGKGGAQVIDTTSGAQQQFGQMLQRQQQQRQLELKQLTDQQAQLKPGALRNQAELGDFLNYQNDWRQKSVAAINERDPYKKAVAQSEADMAYQKANNFVARSKQAQVQDQQVGSVLADPTKRYNYAPGAVDQYTANLNTSIDDPKFIKNVGTTLQAAPDYDYFNKTNKGINEKLISGATPEYKLDKPIKDPSGKMLQPWTLGQSIDPMAENGLAHQIANQATADPKYLNALHARNPDLFANVQNENDQHVAINMAAAREAQQGELYRKVGHGLNKPAETPAEKLQLSEAEWDYKGKHPHITYTQANTKEPDVVQKTVAGAYAGNDNSKQTIADWIPTDGMKKGEKPAFAKGTNGDVINIPATYSPKTLKEMEDAEKSYNPKDHLTGNIFSSNRQPIPFEQSDVYKRLSKGWVPKKNAETIPIPSDEAGHSAKIYQVLADHGVKIGAINEGGGGHDKTLQNNIKAPQQQATPPAHKKIKNTEGI